MNKFPIWLRWALLLPASSALYFAAHFFIKFITTRKDEDGNSSILAIVAPGLACGVAGYAFIAIGTLFAPTHKKLVGIILFVIVILVAGLGLSILLIKGFSWDILLETVGQSIGGATAMYFVTKSESGQIELFD